MSTTQVTEHYTSKENADVAKDYDPKKTVPRPHGTPRHVLGVWTSDDGTRYFDDLTPEEIKDIEEPLPIEIGWVKVWV